MSQDGTNRRTFLQRASTASLVGVIGLGATGSAAGRTGGTAVEDLDRDPAAAVFDEHAADLLAGLAEAGYLERGAAAALPLDGDRDAVEGAVRLRRADRSDEVLTTTDVGDRTLTVVVRLDDGHAYAMEESADGVRRFTPERGFEPLDQVEPTNCDCYNIVCPRDQYPTQVCEYCSGICDGCCTTATCGC